MNIVALLRERILNIQLFQYVFIAVFVLLILSQLASLFWTFVTPNKPLPVTYQSSNASFLSMVSFANSQESTVVARVNKPVKQETKESAPETKLAWKLQGTYLEGGVRDESIAIVNTGNAIYSVGIGDEIEDDILITEIYYDSILLDNKGSTELLSLGSDDLFDLNLGLNSNVLDPAQKVSLSSHQDLNIFDDIVLSQSYIDDELVIILDDKNKGELLKTFGLASGDILLEVEGIAATIDNLDKIALALKENKKISAKIKRKGKIQELTIAY